MSFSLKKESTRIFHLGLKEWKNKMCRLWNALYGLKQSLKLGLEDSQKVQRDLATNKVKKITHCLLNI